MQNSKFHKELGGKVNKWNLVGEIMDSPIFRPLRLITIFILIYLTTMISHQLFYTNPDCWIDFLPEHKNPNFHPLCSLTLIRSWNCCRDINQTHHPNWSRIYTVKNRKFADSILHFNQSAIALWVNVFVILHFKSMTEMIQLLWK